MNFNLLRPVVFADLKVGEVLQAYSGLLPTVAYKAPAFAVLKFEDGSEGCYEIYKLETSYKLVPLCWVENKPVYPGDGPLYYKDNPAWGHNEEGVFALSIRDDELLFHGGMAFPITDATWTKPERKPIPSFQVEGVDVFGDHLVPMPVRDAAEMKNGDDYYTPSLDTEEGYLAFHWTSHGFDFEVYDKGLVHRTKEAAIAHTEALIALSKKKD